MLVPPYIGGKISGLKFKGSLKNIIPKNEADQSNTKELKKENKLTPKNIDSLSEATSSSKELKKESKLTPKNIDSSTNSSLDDLKFPDK